MTAKVKLGKQGRLVLPAAFRRALGVRSGDTLVARLEEGRLVMEKPADAVTRIQARFAAIPRGVRLAQELLAGRREEAAAEDRRA
jgi:AbrB family looped-hinge helix DNA binding protein